MKAQYITFNKRRKQGDSFTQDELTTIGILINDMCESGLISEKTAENYINTWSLIKPSN